MKIKIYLILILLVKICNSEIVSKNVSISRVIDSNLFLLDDGTNISLANIETPSINSPDSSMNDIAKSIVKYATNNLKGRNFRIEYIKPSNSNLKYLPVHLFQEFDFSEDNINALFLGKGYGKYVVSQDTLYQTEYILKCNNAKENKLGVWSQSTEKDFSAGSYKIISFYGTGRTMPFYENKPFDRAFYEFYLKFNYDSNSPLGFFITTGIMQSKEEFENINGRRLKVAPIKASYYTLGSSYRFEKIKLSLGVLYYDPPFYDSSHPLLIGLTYSLLKNMNISYFRNNHIMYNTESFSLEYNLPVPDLTFEVIGFTKSSKMGVALHLTYVMADKYILSSEISNQPDKNYMTYRFGVGYIFGNYKYRQMTRLR